MIGPRSSSLQLSSALSPSQSRSPCARDHGGEAGKGGGGWDAHPRQPRRVVQAAQVAARQGDDPQGTWRGAREAAKSARLSDGGRGVSGSSLPRPAGTMCPRTTRRTLCSASCAARGWTGGRRTTTRCTCARCRTHAPDAERGCSDQADGTHAEVTGSSTRSTRRSARG